MTARCGSGSASTAERTRCCSSSAATNEPGSGWWRSATSRSSSDTEWCRRRRDRREHAVRTSAAGHAGKLSGERGSSRCTNAVTKASCAACRASSQHGECPMATAIARFCDARPTPGCRRTGPPRPWTESSGPSPSRAAPTGSGYPPSGDLVAIGAQVMSPRQSIIPWPAIAPPPDRPAACRLTRWARHATRRKAHTSRRVERPASA